MLSLLFENFGAPGWVPKFTTTFVLVGFPVACLMAWGFDITPEGVRPVPPVPKDATPLPVSNAVAPPAPAVESSAAPSIAVLSFRDLSAEHDQQYLGDGIAEELLNALATRRPRRRRPHFCLSFHGNNATTKEIGEVLHVRHVLEGSVRRSGPKLRVSE